MRIFDQVYEGFKEELVDLKLSIQEQEHDPPLCWLGNFRKEREREIPPSLKEFCPQNSLSLDSTMIIVSST